jgi:cation:H+ antiporter
VSQLPLSLLLLIFAMAAAAIWIAGRPLTAHTDILSTRWNLGAALGGLILLAFATNLPEVAIVMSAAQSGNIGIATGNILGGIAIQTVLLVVLEVFGLRGPRPLTYWAASLALVVEAGLVVALLAVVIAASRLPGNLIAFRLTPGAVLITILWIVGLMLTRRADRSMPWYESGQAPDNQERPRGYNRDHTEDQATESGISTARSATIFGIAALVTLVAGVITERSGEVIADAIGLSGGVFGATVLAAATALPAISTGLAAVRNEDYQLAISDVLGGNAFLPVLFLPAILLSGQAMLPQVRSTDIYLTALGILLTLVYGAGLLLRPRRRIARMGIDSLVALILYVIGIAGLFFIPGALT